MTQRANTVSMAVESYSTKGAFSRAYRHSNKEERIEDNHSNTQLIPERTKLNIVYKNGTREQAIKKVTRKAVERYNNNEAKPSRRITDPVAKVDGMNSKTFREMVFTIGASDELSDEYTGDVSSIDYKSQEYKDRANALHNFARELPTILPNFEIYYMTLHLDESNPHLHVFYLQHSEKEAKFNISFDHEAAMKENLKANGITELKLKPFDEQRKLLEDKLTTAYELRTGHKMKKDNGRKTRRSLSMKEFKRVMKPVHDKMNDVIQILKQARDLLTTLKDDLDAIKEYKEFLEDKVSEVEARDIQEREAQLPDIDIDKIIESFDELQTKVEDTIGDNSLIDDDSFLEGLTDLQAYLQESTITR